MYNNICKILFNSKVTSFSRGILPSIPLCTKKLSTQIIQSNQGNNLIKCLPINKEKLNKDIFDVPPVKNYPIIDEKYKKDIFIPIKIIDTPKIKLGYDIVKNEIFDPVNLLIEKLAARMIVIRRKKMRKHKRKKLVKKMKFVWAKHRHRLEIAKEKAFQSELLASINEAKKFDAVKIAAEKIRKAHEELIPKLWKGKRLPEFVIKELLIKRDEKIKAMQEKNYRWEDRKQFQKIYYKQSKD